MRERADAIVVLGCRVLPSGRLSSVAAARTAAAARAYAGGVARVVVASGGRRWGPYAEADRMKAALVEAGVPAAAVLPELCSLSTFENAVFAGALLRRLGARRAAVVTSDWHMGRALANFRAVGLDVFAVASSGPAPLLDRASRAVRERVTWRLDLARHVRRGLLSASADRFA
ncbi:MAG TPA: YdcF family protein, partial [Minicystis sp.]|nr:YdcF family protein [Minicystis sp.]